MFPKCCSMLRIYLNLAPKLFRNVSFCKNSNLKLNLEGIYPPITTPLDNNGNVSYEDLKQNLRFYESVPFRGYVVFGTNGEPVSLTEEERINIVKLIRQFISKDKLIICGTGCQSTKGTISLTQKMSENGADAAIVITPSYYKAKMTEEALYDYYSKVADNSSIPVVLYNFAANTGVDMTPSLIAKLADHPNIIGLKESGGDISKIGHIIHLTSSKGFQVLAGSAGFLYPALSLGCVGGISALANILGNEVCTLKTLVDKGHHEAAQDLQLQLIGPNSCVTRRFGIAGLKAAMDKMGLYGGPVHSPLLPLSQNEIEILIKEFNSNGFTFD